MDKRTRIQDNLRTNTVSRRRFLSGAGAAGLGVLLGAAPQSSDAERAARAARPNLLIILSDDHSAPHLSCYGDANLKTPNLDRFASQGIRFTRAYVTASQCVPSRASILTGRCPVGIQMARFSAPLPAEVPTLPDLLRSAGYFTGLGGRTYHLDGQPGSPEVQKLYDERGLATMPGRVDWVNRDANREKAPQFFREFLDKVPAGRPFFLQFCFSDPHRPFTAGLNRDPNTLKLPGHYPDTAILREDLASYYAELERLDGDIGVLLSVLDERKLSDNTLVLFMGDNGCSLLRGKGTLYELGVHVPLIVRWPGVARAGSVADSLVSGEDITPTLLAAAGVPAAQSMTGVSFLPVLRGESVPGRRYVFCQRGAHATGLPDNRSAFDLLRCVITPRHKLIYNALPGLSYAPIDIAGSNVWKHLADLKAEGKLPSPFAAIYHTPQRPMFELYDLENDPAELNNLAGKSQTATLERELKAELSKWMVLERDFLPIPLVDTAAVGGKAAANKAKRAANRAKKDNQK